MQFFRYLGCILILFTFQTAHAESLKDRIGQLKILSLQYGVNTLEVSGVDTFVIRGRFENGNAWGGDAYTVLQKQGQTWQFVRHEDIGWEGILTATQPHVEEDALTSVAFMTEKIKPAHLYLLKTHRNYKNSPLDIVPAEFTLYILQPDPDFATLYFHKLETTLSKAKYCNSDSAAYHELGIPLPGDEEEYKCVTPSSMQ